MLVAAAAALITAGLKVWVARVVEETARPITLKRNQELQTPEVVAVLLGRFLVLLWLAAQAAPAS
jgi:hypothetical protein